MNLWAAVVVVTTLLLSLVRPAHAQPIERDQVPAELRDWIPWVLEDAGEELCPGVNGVAVCVWPGELALDLGDTGGSFTLDIRTDLAATVEIPGSAKHWPQDVEVNGKPAVVLESSETPTVRLGRGDHVVKGRFYWKSVPEVLKIPGQVARVRLSLRGEAVRSPKRSTQGGVWLEAADAGRDEPERLDMEVFRRIDDGVPLLVTTRLQLRVAGKAREVSLGKPLLEGSRPLAIESALAVRLEPDGELIGQLRAGEHAVELQAYYPSPPETLPATARPAPWPSHEIWSWAPNAQLRQVTIDGAVGIDPTRTNMPAEWQKLQALRLTPPATVRMHTVRRGEPEPPPNQLRMAREMWLDLDGKGFTIRDTFRGTMTRDWRLDLEAGVLGMAEDHDVAQLVTVNPVTGNSGVELRAGDVEIVGEWRLEGTTARLPAVAWSEDVQSLHTTLRLPPGWQLLLTRGVDEPPKTWLTDWNPWDVFVMLVVAAAAWRLLGVGAGILALLSLGLSHHSPHAPQATWVVLLALIALLRVVGRGRLRELLRAGWVVAVAVLVAVGAQFAARELRSGFYPGMQESPENLDRETEQVAQIAADNREGGTGTRAKGEEGSMGAPSANRERRYGVKGPGASDDEQLARQQALKDAAEFGMVGLLSSGAEPMKAKVSPQAVIQTGPGVPSWTWSSWRLSWSGSVDRAQSVRLYLLSPTESGALSVLRVLLVAALAWLLVRRSSLGKSPPPNAPRGKGAKQAAVKGKAAAAAVAATVALVVAPSVARAQPPSAELLSELKNRLLRPPECRPDCVSVSTLAMSLEQRTIELDAQVHAGASGAYKLPGPAATWVPRTIELDGKPAVAVALLADGFLHVRVGPGRHRVRVVGPVSGDSLTLTLGTTPRRVTVAATGWQVDGLDGDGTAQGSIQLSRLADTPAGEPTAEGEKPGSDATTASLPPWLSVERTFHLGATWKVTTKLTRRSPTGVPIVVRFPLLEREKVVTAGPIVEGEEVVLSLGRDDQEVSWTSSLEPRKLIELRAAENKPWTEQWTLDCSIIWHCELDGVAPVRRVSDNGQWSPQFRPWPGEQVRWTVHQPPPAEGPTATVDRAVLKLRPGARLIDAWLTLDIRSSTGGTQTITVPAEAKVQRLTIGSEEQPVRREGNIVSIALVPGEQKVGLHWQQPGELGTYFRTPRVELGGSAVNASVKVEVPWTERWVVAAGGSRWGPQVLLWGQLALLLVVAVALGRLRRSPLTTAQWALLAVGLTQVPTPLAVVLPTWFFLADWRARWSLREPNRRNLAQIAMVAWTAVFVGCVGAVALANLRQYPPSVEPYGFQYGYTGASGNELYWYADRISGALPEPWLVSVPAWVWRLGMLAWTLWLAWLLVRWMRKAWTSFTDGGAWRPWQSPLGARRALAAAAAEGPDSGAPSGSPDVGTDEVPASDRASRGARSQPTTKATPASLDAGDDEADEGDEDDADADEGKPGKRDDGDR